MLSATLEAVAVLWVASAVLVLVGCAYEMRTTRSHAGDHVPARDMDSPEPAPGRADGHGLAPPQGVEQSALIATATLPPPNEASGPGRLYPDHAEPAEDLHRAREPVRNRVD